MSARNLTNKKELPYIPLGPFQWRIPGIHYHIEKVEFFQGIILGATALSSIPYMTDCLGLPYELAWSCVIIEVFLYMLHGWLGEDVYKRQLCGSFTSQYGDKGNGGFYE